MRRDAGVHIDVAIGRLPHVQRAVNLTQRVRVFEIAGEQRERNQQREHHSNRHIAKESAARAFFPAHCKCAARRSQRRNAEPQQLRRLRKSKRKRERNRRPHHHDQPDYQSEPEPNRAARFAQQRVRRNAAAE